MTEGRGQRADTAASERAYKCQLLWLRYEHSWIELKLRLLEWELALKAGYRPGQPRIPAGRPGGGQWTDGDNGVIPVAEIDRPGKDRYLNPHITANHVGKSDVELVERIRRSHFRLFGYSRGLDRNGSFASAEAVRDFINRTLAANQDMVARVAGWSV